MIRLILAKLLTLSKADLQLAAAALPAAGRVASIRQRARTLPRWLHAVTLGYALTNLFNLWALVVLAPNAVVIALGAVGLVGGFAEHLTPYAPRLEIPMRWERVLFRLPTIVALGWMLWSLNLWVGWLAAFAIWSVVFWLDSSLNTQSPRFHVQHLLVTHGLGTVATAVLLVGHFEWVPWVTTLVRTPFG